MFWSEGQMLIQNENPFPELLIWVDKKVFLKIMQAKYFYLYFKSY